VLSAIRSDSHAEVVAEATETEEPFGRDDSVEQCLEIVKEVSAEQRARARHLDTKTGTLAGFAATIFTLNATLGRPILETHLTSTAADLIKVFFAASVVALGLAALTAVAGVLRPMGHDDLDEEQIDAYGDRPKVITPPADLRMTWLQTVVKMTLSDRKAGSRKSTYMKVAVGLLVVGVLGVAGQALTLVLDSDGPAKQPAASGRQAPKAPGP
jgi:hypothetical protein